MTKDWQFQGVVRFTRIGVTYLLFTLVAGFAAINTGNNALYIGLTFMLGGLLLSGIASKGGLKHLEVEFVTIEQAWAGRVAHGTLRIHNRSRIWNVRDVILVSPDLAEPLYVPLLPRWSVTQTAAAFRFSHRGIAELEKIDLYTRYPFGFFFKKRRTKLLGEVVVFPRLLEEQIRRDRFRAIEGEQVNSLRPGPGTDVHSFREYVRGDSLRQVHWKKSASLGRWIMKQTELEAGRAVHVIVDPFKPAGVSDDEFELMISSATTFVFSMLDRGFEVVFSLPRMTQHVKSGEDANDVYRALALVQPQHEPVAQTIESQSVLFAVGELGAKSA